MRSPRARVPDALHLAEPGYWQRLLPTLNYTARRPYPAPAWPGGEPLADPQQLRADILRYGYHVGRSRAPFAAELAASIAALARDGLHPNWVLLADELWLLTKAFEPLLRAAFPHLAIISDHQMFVVDPSDPDRHRGWSPHHDREDMPFRGDERTPDYVTVWIALTDATPENGCIYLVPAPDDPRYYTLEAWRPPEDPQSIIAVPAPAGTPIFWTGRTVHWGGRVAPVGAPAAPRIAASFAAANPEYETGPIDIAGARALPTLEERVELFFAQIDAYQKRVPDYAVYDALRARYRARV